MVIAARIAMGSSAERSAWAMNSLACSRTNSFPSCPEGTEKMLRRQCTISAWALMIAEVNVSPLTLPHTKLSPVGSCELVADSSWGVIVSPVSRCCSVVGRAAGGSSLGSVYGRVVEEGRVPAGFGIC